VFWIDKFSKDKIIKFNKKNSVKIKMKKKVDNSTILCVEHFTEKGVFENNPFMLIDVGCSGGIDSRWKCFGNNLKAYGIDPVLGEIESLNENESNPNIKYIPGYIGLPMDHIVRLNRKNKSPWGNVPSNRLSSFWATELLAKNNDNEKIKMGNNRWPETELAPMSSLYGLDNFVSVHDLDSVDFVKIDVDGDDYYALLTCENIIDSHQILGMFLEVNYYGTDCETDNTFHNTDRLMKKYGFELCDISVKRYSKKVLPSRFVIGMPAETEFGVPYQGDTLYIRDVVRAKNEGKLSELSIDKLCKLIVIYKIYGLPDCAAEVLLNFEKEFTRHGIDIELILDLLTPKFNKKKVSYREYISIFEDDANKFMPGVINFIERQLNIILRFLKS
jgi:methyltransferase FkbM-like protein